MLENVRKRMGREEGFTLVELLVVMLILGILAAIAIPTFLSQRDKANDAEAKAAARTAQTAAETYGTDHNNDYTGLTTAAQLEAIEPALAEAPNAVVISDQSATGEYTVTVQSSTGTDFSVERSGARSDQTCAPDGGGCTAGGW